MAAIDFSIEGFEFCQDCGTFVKVENYDFDSGQCKFCEADEALEAEAAEAFKDDPYVKDLEELADLEDFG